MKQSKSRVWEKGAESLRGGGAVCILLIFTSKQKRILSNITIDIIDNMCYNIVKLKTK